MALTAKQAQFVAEYMIDLNATQAAIRAGYSFATAPAGFYTYLLIDPRDGSVIYVGKGKGRRISSHVRDAVAGKIGNAQKHRRIVEVMDAGMVVSEVVFALHDTEQEAYSVEREIIKKLRHSGITNIVSGVSTNAEIDIQQAKYALGRMKTFEEWIGTAKPFQIAAAEKLRGSAKACYEAIRDELVKIASPC